MLFVRQLPSNKTSFIDLLYDFLERGMPNQNHVSLVENLFLLTYEFFEHFTSSKKTKTSEFAIFEKYPDQGKKFGW
tara:strand:+ start:2573 stop:2800 length:228 start_codon:yes stop_codon:yes gene_type:complete